MSAVVSSEVPPQATMNPSTAEDVPGKPLCAKSHVLDVGSTILQSFDPIKRFTEHVCTWAIFSQDMTRQIETHHYVSRLNEDVQQCIVYDSDAVNARLIGVEYIVSERLFEALPEDEQKLWHSHFYEIKAGLWVNPGVPEIAAKPALKKLAKTYGKFWCTWQFDRGDRLPFGPPALMMSPQEGVGGHISQDLIQSRDQKYNISTSAIAESRGDIQGPDAPHAVADQWVNTKKGWAVDLKPVDISLKSGHPLATLQ